MKILFFTNEYSHTKLPNSGGVGSFLKIMSESLSKQGHDIFVYGFSKKPIEFKDKGIHFKFIKKYSKQFRFNEFIRSSASKLGHKKANLNFLIKERKYYAKKLKTHCRKNNIDIIESFVFNGYTAYWDNSTPLVLRFHGSRGFWHYYLGAEKDEFKIEMEQIALKKTKHLIAVSKFSADAVKKIYNINIQNVIYNGIDSSFFAPDEKKFDTKKQSIFYFGTISKAKGVDILCDVFNSISLNFPDATLHLIGRGQNYWEHLSKEVLTSNALKKTTYYGPKNPRELTSLLQEANICVFPSLNENFSLAIEEAMSLKKIVIASDIPAFKEIINHGENGLIAHHKKDYITLISYIFKSPESYSPIAVKAREDILENYTKEKMVAQTLTLYKSILSNKF
ncbi:glycosyltransferase family 4 protein [Winogradskyella sp. SYSU M77433]|uniref:glycosyltransferase family 4 protein n=1 Tax=Winogradskyella sp. SYSU M77433 TaxID=3042722 RepID=UPI00247FAB57|nr:glycosyltransferase family 4 protein [Winogradskyella sp. SYSU M77433]MDH7911181.1 glycosyltransferase family 4 protein [Winogradskyella sp. SYSU M77433]